MKRIVFFIIWGYFFSIELMGYIPVETGVVGYQVSIHNPHTHYFEVEIKISNYDADFIDVKMPVWTPGSYLIREYAKNVEDFAAYAGNEKKPLEFNKINKNTWRIMHQKVRDVVIKYQVYAFEGTVRMSYLDEHHAFIMANTLLMYVDDLKNNSSVLKINFPETWKNVSTSLTRLDMPGYAYYVPDYDILVDSPIEIGNHEIMAFTAAGIPHEVVMFGRTYFNKDQLVRDLTKIVESATAVFGENPNEKYVFIIHHSDQGTGGLEHISSTVLGVNRWAYSTTSSYNSFLSLAAHEYFHLWMVKRLKPVELEVMDYDNEIYTDLLWVMEGITSYFDQKIMLDCGLYTDQQFITSLLSTMSNIRNTPGSREQSVAEASFDAWIKYYKKNENSNNSQISYYNKGMILGALLDLVVIDGSEGEQTLDNVISQLYHQYYKKKGKGITNDDLRRALEKASKQDLTDFFNDYVFGTKDLNYEKYLHKAGIALIETNGAVNKKTIGITYNQNGYNLIINSVVKGGSAYDNGLNVGDELISIDGFRVSHSNINNILNHLDVGEVVPVLLSRDGLILEKELDIRKDNSVNYSYELLDNRSKLQEQVYKAWLGK